MLPYLLNMAQRKQTFATGEFYHLYNRGTDKRIIFANKTDYDHFLNLMYVCNTTRSIELRDMGKNFERGETIVNIGAYCLMPNHFHILVHEKIDGGISKYMLKLMTSYSMYFNKKYDRTGKLYEGVFKSSHASSDPYLKYLYSYIHLNPAKLIDKNWRKKTRDPLKLLKFTYSYPYSSIMEYANSKFTIINHAQFPAFFKEPSDQKKELFEWLDFEC